MKKLTIDQVRGTDNNGDRLPDEKIQRMLDINEEIDKLKTELRRHELRLNTDIFDLMEEREYIKNNVSYEQGTGDTRGGITRKYFVYKN